MTKDELNRFISVTVGLSVALWLALVYVAQVDPASVQAVRLLSFVVTAVTVFWFVYFRFGWRVPVLKHLFHKPNLNGTWIGTLQSDYTDERGEKVPPLDIAVVVRQSFLFTHVTSLTDNLVAYSYSDTLLIDDERARRRLIYLYSEKSLFRPGTGAHQGTAELTLVGEPTRELLGAYWTNRKTAGSIHLVFASRTHVHSFGEARSKWPSPWDVQALPRGKMAGG